MSTSETPLFTQALVDIVQHERRMVDRLTKRGSRVILASTGFGVLATSVGVALNEPGIIWPTAAVSVIVMVGGASRWIAARDEQDNIRDIRNIAKIWNNPITRDQMLRASRITLIKFPEKDGEDPLLRPDDPQDVT